MIQRKFEVKKWPGEMSQNRVLVEPTVAPDLSHKGRPFELDDEKGR